MDQLFKFHKLNQQGQAKALAVAMAFDRLLFELVYDPENTSREWSICKTKLEEACFYAKKAIALNPENQDGQD